MIDHRSELLFVRILIPYLMGIILYYHFNYLWPGAYLSIFCLFVFLCLSVINISYRKIKAYKFKPLTGFFIHVFFFFAGGFLCIANKQSLHADYYTNLPATHLKITVADEPQLKGKILRFKASVIESYLFNTTDLFNATGHNAKSTKINAQTASGSIMVAFKTDSLSPIQLNYGDELIIPSHFSEIKAAQHPAMFDYKSWLASQNIYHQTFLKRNQLLLLKSNRGNPLVTFALQLRAKQVALYRRLIKDDEAFAVAATLVLGYRADLSKETLAIYSKTGTIHALSVSGMHVGMIYLILNQALRFLDIKKSLRLFKVILMLFMIWFYALFTGFSPSVLRSVIMLSVFIIARSFSRHTNSYNILAFTAFCILVYNPFLIWDVGFQLSFLAVFGLIYLQPKIQQCWDIENKWLNKLWGVVAMSLAAQLLTFPSSIYYFHQFPLYFLISNLFILVPVALLMYIGIFLLFFRFDFLGPVFEGLISFTNNGLSWIAKLPFSSLSSIWISRTELFLLSAFLILMTLALVNLRKQLLYAAGLSLLLFQSLRSYDSLKAQRQEKIMVFNTQKEDFLVYIKANTARIYGNLQNDSKTFQYQIQPVLARQKVSIISFTNKNPVPKYILKKNTRYLIDLKE